jgi:hypothetical protein
LADEKVPEKKDVFFQQSEKPLFIQMNFVKFLIILRVHKQKNLFSQLQTRRSRKNRCEEEWKSFLRLKWDENENNK